MLIRVLLVKLREDTFLGQLTSDWESVPYHCILWLSPYGDDLSYIMNQASQVEPVQFGMAFPDALRCLETVH